jgi:hypothetical protein
MALSPMTASQTEQAALLMRQAETANMALTTAYREQHGPSDALVCMICESGALFVLTPDGQVMCDDCGLSVGRWAAQHGLLS